MNSSLEIITDNTHEFVVQRSIAGIPWVGIITLVILGIVCLGVFYQPKYGTPTAPPRFLLYLWLGAMVTLFAWGLRSNTVTLTPANDNIAVIHRFAGVPYSTQNYAVSTLREIVVEYRNATPRVALLLQDNAVIYPLGGSIVATAQVGDVVSRMNDYIHPRPGGADAPPQTHEVWVHAHAQ